jgi:N-acetylmuramoyl-L-alanine amidase
LKRFSWNRSRTRTGAALLCILLTAGYGQARVHRSQSWADAQFDKAESQRETLESRAEQSRTRHEYETVIASYRLVVLEAPTSSKADGSAFAVAELTAEMGRRFKDDSALNSALREYKFLRQEYPGSKHRVAALLAIGTIYKNDLGDDADGREALEELLRRYPHGPSADEARAVLGLSAGPASSSSLSSSSSWLPKASNSGNANSTSDSATEKVQNSHDAADIPSTASAATNDDGSDEPVRVTAVRHWSAPDYTRVTVELDQNHDVQFAAQRIDNPDRIFFDLKNTRLSSELIGRSFDVDDGLVKKVRVAQYKPGRARIVIETADRSSYNASLLMNPPRLVIDVRSGSSAVEQAQSAGCAGEDDRSTPSVPSAAQGGLRGPTTAFRPTTSSSAGARGATKTGFGGTGVPAPAGANAPSPCAANENLALAKVIPAAEHSAPPASASAVKKVVVEAESDDDDSPDASDSAPAKVTKSSKANLTPVPASSAAKTRLAAAMSMRGADPTSNGDRSLIRALGLKIGKIVIDPGHGGHDTGTIGPNGLLEKDLVLDVSKRLGKLLEARLGAQVVFTRRDDTFIPLETRTVIANQEQADLFVSVHANSSHDPDARGVETYYLNFTSSPEALEVAARENAASDQDIHELQDLVKKIALKEKIDESREFASDVQESLHSGLAAKTSGVRDRGVKKAPFVVLIGANMPSILAEISFISNPGDEKRLQSPDYRQRIAESLYRGISRYVNGLGGVKVASKVEKASGE